MHRAEQSGAAHPHHDRPGIPEACKHHADNGGLDGEVILIVYVAEEARLRTHAARGNGVHAAAGGHDQAVHRAEAGYGDENIHDSADDVAEQLRERKARQALAERPCGNDGVDIAHDAHRPDIQRVENYRHQRADDQCARQVLFRVFKFCVDACCEYPALVGEGKADDGLEKSRAVNGDIVGGIDIVEHLERRAVDKAGNGSGNAHEDERNELDDRHSDLELAGDLRAERVDAVADHQKSRADTDCNGVYLAVCKVDRRYAEQLQKHHCREKRQHRRKRRSVDRCHEPTYIIGILGAERKLGVVNDAVDFLILAAKRCKNQRADDAYQADDADDRNALQKVAARKRQDLAAFDKDTGTDDDADDHGNRGRQSVPFFHFVFHYFLSINSFSCFFNLKQYINNTPF